MRKVVVHRLALLLGVAVVAACGPAPKSAQPNSAGQPAAAESPNRGKPLNLAVRYDINDLFPKRTGGAASSFAKRTFNASLALIDDSSNPRPYLAAALPQLNSATWQVSPDGKME